MNRPTPFDLYFRDLAPDLDAITGTADRAAFLRDPVVQRLLARIEPPDMIERDVEAASEYATVLYAAWRFHRAGQRVLAVERERLEAALDDAPGATSPEVPGGACYVQLPHQWFWGQVGADAPHEPVDGLFVTQSRPDELLLVAVLGLRPERGGFSQVSVIAPPDDVAAAAALARADRFAPVLEGGALAGFRSVVSAAELLLLARLALLHTAR